MYYLTTPFSVGFNPNTRPSFKSQVNGMSTKTNAVKHALNCKLVSTIEELSDINAPLLIEPLWFKPHSKEEETLEERLDALRQVNTPKYLLCSEFTPLRWAGKHTASIIETVHSVFASCEFQMKLMNAIGIETEAVVYEPVNEHLFYPTHKQDWVLAIGSPTHMKNTEAIIEIFQGLQGSGLHRVFIGSPIVWGNIRGMKNEKSYKDTIDTYERLKAVCDVHYTAASQIFVAYMFSRAKYYLNFAYHETCCRTAMEAMLCGTNIIAGKHPLWEEYPCLASGLEPSEAVDLLTHEAEPMQVEGLRDWALKNVSYAAFKSKIEGLLK